MLFLCLKICFLMFLSLVTFSLILQLLPCVAASVLLKFEHTVLVLSGNLQYPFEMGCLEAWGICLTLCSFNHCFFLIFTPTLLEIACVDLSSVVTFASVFFFFCCVSYLLFKLLSTDYIQIPLSI